MGPFEITCTIQEPPWRHPACARITGVGVVIGTEGVKILSVEQVVGLIDRGATFRTFGRFSRKSAKVEAYWCRSCARSHIRTEADSEIDNNLDSLQACPLKRAA
jgi:hypothetical protein